MKLKIYQIDAFAQKVFEGNPAAVCPLDFWLEDDLLQKIAEENNLSETAFFVPCEKGFELRWFTPVKEVDLCGHATLACAHVLYQHLGFTGEQICFQTKSGELLAEKSDQGFSLNFPASFPKPIEAPEDLSVGLGISPQQVLAALDYIVVLNDEDEVNALSPDFLKWMTLDLRGVVVTAPGNTVDFVSRCFFPKLRVNEDPVTGSAHCELMPYWAKRLNKDKLVARQLSKRSGTLACQIKDDRVILTGTAVDFMMGEIII